jgi:hypothetical protein
MGSLPNEFSWSISRKEIFDYCRRKYYLNYYGSWGGWDLYAPEETQLVYFLKQRSFADMWVGDAVHKAIRYTITKRNTITEKEVGDALLRRLDHDHGASLSRRFGMTKAKEFWLFEHYKGRQVDLDALKEKGLLCLRNFFRTDVYGELLSIPDDDILYLDDGDINKMKFSVNGFTFYAIPDLAYRSGSEGVKIVDWKTGRASETVLSDQLKVYAWRLNLLHGIDPDQQPVHGQSIFLQDGASRGRMITGADLAGIDELAQKSIGDMRTLLAEPASNTPMPMDRFPMTENRNKCAACAYWEVCERYV